MPGIANLVRVLSSTTGTGTLTLGSAVAGFLTPTQAGMVDGKVYTYVIEADYVTVGDDLVPTSREAGRGAYTASGGTLARGVANSTNSNALLSLTGDEQVIIAVLQETVRELLTADRTYYVRTDGNDANSGLANTSAGAKLTFAGAYDAVTSLIDFGGYTVTISMQNTAWTAAVNLGENWLGNGALVIDFNTGSLTVTSASCIEVGFFGCANLTIKNVTLSAVTNNRHCFNMTYAGQATLGPGIIFSTSGGAHVSAGNTGTTVNLADNYTISGNAKYHVLAVQANVNIFPATVTISGTPAFSLWFLAASGPPGFIIYAPGTTSGIGSVTGNKAWADALALIQGDGAGPSTLPGDGAIFMTSGGIII